jgi:methionyl aminopeptidase
MSELTIKTPDEIEIMRRGGKIAALVLERLSKIADPGMTVWELDALAEDIILKAGAKPSFKGFKGYPSATCISINEEIVHGIPSDRVLKKGDVIGIDVGVLFEGFHTDTAVTIGLEPVSLENQRLIEVTEEALSNGLKQIKAGSYLGDAQAAIQQTIENESFGVIRDLTGHGVGRDLQEAPAIPNYGEPGRGLLLQEGMTLAIEPMVSLGDWHIDVLDDGWTVVTADKSTAAHFEHTIVVTKDGCEILTKL